jgi:sulfite reductase (ferredoxin)
MVQRDFGNRADRSQARLKYTIHNMGLPAFKQKVEEYLSEAESICGVHDGTLPRPLPQPHPDDVTGHDDHMGWHQQGDGKWFLGLPIENGRVKDEGDLRLKTAIRVLFSDHVTNCRLTAQQNILLCDIEPSQRDTIQQVLSDHGVVTVEQISNARRFSFACPALPTGGLAVTESERALPGVIDDIEAELSDLGLTDEQFSIRMTGCPNGSALLCDGDPGCLGSASVRHRCRHNRAAIRTIWKR